MSTGARGLRRVVGALAALDEANYPRAVSVILGLAGGALGVLFLVLPDRLSTPAFAPLISAAHPVVWGVVLLAIGSSLTTAAIMDYRRSYVLSGALGLVLFVFSLLSGVGIVAGATGIVTVLTLSTATLLLLATWAGVAPRLKEHLS